MLFNCASVLFLGLVLATLARLCFSKQVKFGLKAALPRHTYSKKLEKYFLIYSINLEIVKTVFIKICYVLHNLMI